MIINLHGFLSTGNSNKKKLLIKHFGEDFVYSPNLSISPKESIRSINNYLKENTNYPHILIGSSLGGLYAFYLFIEHDIPTYLINPSFSLSINFFNQNNFNSWKQLFKEELNIDILKELIELNKNFTSDLNSNLLHFYLGKNDSIINSDYINDELFNHCSKTWLDDGHRIQDKNFEKYVIADIKLFLKI